MSNPWNPMLDFRREENGYRPSSPPPPPPPSGEWYVVEVTFKSGRSIKSNPMSEERAEANATRILFTGSFEGEEVLSVRIHREDQ